MAGAMFSVQPLSSLRSGSGGRRQRRHSAWRHSTSMVPCEGDLSQFIQHSYRRHNGCKDEDPII
jgi:hypothetical protein